MERTACCLLLHLERFLLCAIWRVLNCFWGSCMWSMFDVLWFILIYLHICLIFNSIFRLAISDHWLFYLFIFRNRNRLPINSKILGTLTNLHWVLTYFRLVLFQNNRRILKWKLIQRFFLLFLLNHCCLAHLTSFIPVSSTSTSTSTSITFNCF